MEKKAVYKEDGGMHRFANEITQQARRYHTNKNCIRVFFFLLQFPGKNIWVDPDLEPLAIYAEAMVNINNMNVFCHVHEIIVKLQSGAKCVETLLQPRKTQLPLDCE